MGEPDAAAHARSGPAAFGSAPARASGRDATPRRRSPYARHREPSGVGHPGTGLGRTAPRARSHRRPPKAGSPDRH